LGAIANRLRRIRYLAIPATCDLPGQGPANYAGTSRRVPATAGVATSPGGTYLSDGSVRYIGSTYRCIPSSSPRMRPEMHNGRRGTVVSGGHRSGVLELAVLGLLHETPMHGYELRKRLNSFLGAFRAFGYGSLYPCLKELLAQGLIAEEQPETLGS